MASSHKMEWAYSQRQRSRKSTWDR